MNLLSVDLNLAELAKCLNAYCLNHDDDILIWKKDPSGEYSILSSFSFSFEGFEAPYWDLAWVKGMTPKISINFWILLQNKILTLDSLKKRGFIFANRCVLCKNDEESVDHILLHCPFSSMIWDKIWNLMSLDWVPPTTIQLFFLSWKGPSKNLLIIKLWDLILPFFYWGV